MIDETPRSSIEHVVLAGPGYSSGNTLWTIGRVYNGDLTDGYEIEVDPSTSQVETVRHLPVSHFSEFLLSRARLRGFNVDNFL